MSVSFAAPLFLLGLLAVPLAVLVYVKHERGRPPLAASPLLPSVLPRRPGWRRHAAVGGYGLALSALILALARPQATVAVPVEQATVVVVTDRSGSMLAQDVKPSRLVAARKAAASFLDAVPDEIRVGAIAFNHMTTALQSPTRDHAEVAEALNGVKAAGSTATGDALQAALKMIGTTKAPAAVVLLSDGKSVRGSDPLEAARAAKAAKVPVYTVALGTPSGTIETKTGTTAVPPDPATLAEIARISGGETFEAGDAEKLQKVYEKLGSQVATEKSKREVSGAFAGGALLLLAGAAMASLRWFGRFV
jgi:Ca-activated chloride channel family protein